MSNGNAKPYEAPPPSSGPLWIDGLDVRAIGISGTIASIAGRTDSAEQLRLILQQCCRDMTGVRGPNNGMIIFRTCLALYQQLVGLWGQEDQDRLSRIMHDASHPEMLDGPRGLAEERHLSPRAIAELARVTILP